MGDSFYFFLEAITDFALINLDLEGRIQWANKATSSVTGYPIQELKGLLFASLYTTEDQSRKRSEDDLSATLKAGTFSCESWKLNKDGSKYWSEIAISLIRTAQDKHTGYAVVLKDTTVKKQAELEVRMREERYRLMVDGVQEYAIFMLDTKGYVISWNDGAKRIKGYEKNEIIGKHFSTFYTKEDLDDKKPERELEIALQTGKYEEEGWRVHKNSSVFWASVVITALYNQQNKLIGFSKVTRDITGKRQDEEKLRQSEERYRLLVGQVKDYGIFMLDDKGRIISWNEGARRIKGYEAEEILGKYFSIFYPEEDKINDRPGYELKVALKEGKYEEEGWRVRKDGSMFWANVVITAIYNAKGVFIGFAKVTRDLSERKEAERALKDTNEKYRLLADQLQDANKSLARANKELEEFTSVASHDLQEPVRTVKSFLTLIEKQLAAPAFNPAELKHYIQRAIKASNRMRELIANLLQYAQLSKEEVTPEMIHVNELLGEVLQNLRTKIETAGAVITIHAEAEQIKGDRIQLMQLVQNLVSNALKFVENKKPEIRIECYNEPDDVLFSVSDNGIGIPKESQFKIFEIFRRERTAKNYPGTGIGLSICKKIVDRHQGKIWFNSEPGEGTTFYFTLKY